MATVTNLNNMSGPKLRINSSAVAQASVASRQSPDSAVPWQDYQTIFTNAKAGMDNVDKAYVQKVVYEMSKDSAHFRNEKRKQDQVDTRIAQLKARSESLTPAEVAAATRSVDLRIALLESRRDLTRIWIHADMDCFYAAVHEAEKPELKQLPVAVGGMGMISTANYVARKYGVRSAMPGFIAKRLCPKLVFIPPDFRRYTAAAQRVREVFRQLDPEFESGGLDEAYLDVTDYCASSGCSGAEAAEELRRRVRESCGGLTCSCGVAPNKMLAKICSEINKPDGQYELPASRTAILSFLDTLPARKIPFIGKVTEQLLHGVLGVSTCGQLLGPQRARLPLLFSETATAFFLEAALGLAASRHPHKGNVCTELGRKGMSCERTFRNMSSPGEQEDMARQLVDSLAADMAAEQLEGRNLTLKLKLSTFEVRTRAVTLPRHVRCAAEMLPHVLRLLRGEGPLELRLMGVRMAALRKVNSADSPLVRLLGLRLQRDNGGATASAVATATTADGEAAAVGTGPAALPTGQLPQQLEPSPQPQRQPTSELSSESPCDMAPDVCGYGGLGRVATGPSSCTRPEGAFWTEAPRSEAPPDLHVKAPRILGPTWLTTFVSHHGAQSFAEESGHEHQQQHAFAEWPYGIYDKVSGCGFEGVDFDLALGEGDDRVEHVEEEEVLGDLGLDLWDVSCSGRDDPWVDGAARRSCGTMAGPLPRKRPRLLDLEGAPAAGAFPTLSSGRPTHPYSSPDDVAVARASVPAAVANFTAVPAAPLRTGQMSPAFTTGSSVNWMMESLDRDCRCNASCLPTTAPSAPIHAKPPNAGAAVNYPTQPQAPKHPRAAPSGAPTASDNHTRGLKHCNLFRFESPVGIATEAEGELQEEEVEEEMKELVVLAGECKGNGVDDGGGSGATTAPPVSSRCSGAVWRCRVCTYAHNRRQVLRCEVCDCIKGSTQQHLHQEQHLQQQQDAQTEPHLPQPRFQQRQRWGSASVERTPSRAAPRRKQLGAAQLQQLQPGLRTAARGRQRPLERLWAASAAARWKERTGAPAAAPVALDARPQCSAAE